jgi:sugar (pentulose or hexulose) kinase
MGSYLGIDLGTSFFKAAVLDLDRGEVRHVRRLPTPEPVAGLPANRCELDPAAVLAAVRRLIGEMLGDAPDADGLVMCSQMHCVVLTDARGEARSNVITWKDQRVLDPYPRGPGSYFEALLRRLGPEERQRVGGEVRVGVAAGSLFWLAEEGRLPAGACPASLPDFVLSNLCGVGPTTEATNAAAHELLNLARNEWDHEIIAKLGLSSLLWPRRRPFGEVVGVGEVGGHRLRCFTPVGDQQCALAGAGLGEGELSLNISTGSQVSLLAREPTAGDYQVRPYFDGRYLKTIVQVPAGRSLALLVDLLTEIGRAGGAGGPDPWEYVEQAVDRVGASDLEVDLAFYAGAMGRCGRIANIREDNLTVGHLFAAAFRAMADNYAACARRLSPGGDWQRVVFSGGLAQRFPRLRQEILSRLGGKEYRLCPSTEDTLLGLLALARVCAGESNKAG